MDRERTHKSTVDVNCQCFMCVLSVYKDMF